MRLSCVDGHHRRTRVWRGVDPHTGRDRSGCRRRAGHTRPGGGCSETMGLRRSASPASRSAVAVAGSYHHVTTLRVSRGGKFHPIGPPPTAMQSVPGPMCKVIAGRCRGGSWVLRGCAGFRWLQGGLRSVRVTSSRSTKRRPSAAAPARRGRCAPRAHVIGGCARLLGRQGGFAPFSRAGGSAVP